MTPETTAAACFTAPTAAAPPTATQSPTPRPSANRLSCNQVRPFRARSNSHRVITSTCVGGAVFARPEALGGAHFHGGRIHKSRTTPLNRGGQTEHRTTAATVPCETPPPLFGRGGTQAPSRVRHWRDSSACVHLPIVGSKTRAVYSHARFSWNAALKNELTRAVFLD